MAISQKIHKRHSKNKYSRNIKKIGGAVEAPSAEVGRWRKRRRLHNRMWSG